MSIKRSAHHCGDSRRGASQHHLVTYTERVTRLDCMPGNTELIISAASMLQRDHVDKCRDTPNTLTSR